MLILVLSGYLYLSISFGHVDRVGCRRYRGLYDPPFPGNKTDSEKGCLLKVAQLEKNRLFLVV